MSSTKSRARRKVGTHFDGDLRRSLLDAAIEVVVEVGADHVSLREVARRCGVSHAAPAHHFGDKAGLLTAIATEGFELFIEGVSQAAPPAPGTGAVSRERDAVDPTAQLRELGLAYAQFAESF